MLQGVQTDKEAESWKGRDGEIYTANRKHTGSVSSTITARSLTELLLNKVSGWYRDGLEDVPPYIHTYIIALIALNPLLRLQSARQNLKHTTAPAHLLPLTPSITQQITSLLMPRYRCSSSPARSGYLHPPGSQIASDPDLAKGDESMV